MCKTVPLCNLCPMEKTASCVNLNIKLLYNIKKDLLSASQAQIGPTVTSVLFLEPSKFHFFFWALKDGKSGHILMNNRATKGYGFDNGLTSQIVFKELSQCKAVRDVNRYRTCFPSLLVNRSKYDHFSSD